MTLLGHELIFFPIIIVAVSVSTVSGFAIYIGWPRTSAPTSDTHSPITLDVQDLPFPRSQLTSWEWIPDPIDSTGRANPL